MANQETVNIVDLDIDQSALTKKLAELTVLMKGLKEETKQLENAQKSLEQEGKQSSAQYEKNAGEIEKNKAQLKTLNTDYRNNQSTLSALTASQKGQLGTLQQLAIRNKELRGEVKTLDLSQKKGRDRLKEINKELDKNNKFIKENADATLKQKMNIGNYQSALQGLPGPLTRIVTGFKAMTKAAWAFIATPIGLVIAAVAAAVATLTSYFRRSEEGQDRFRKITKTLLSVLDNLLDKVDAVGKFLYNAIAQPRKAWESFKDFIKGLGEFFVNTFGNVIGGSFQIFVGLMEKGFANVGIGWQKLKGLFTDNAEKIAESQAKVEQANEKIRQGQEKLKEGTKALSDAYQNARQKVKDYYDEIINDAKIAQQLADSEAALRKIERRDLVENAKLRSESAKLRADAEKEKFIDAQKSIDLYNQSFDIDEKVLESELTIAKQRAENARIQATLANSDIETLDKIAQLEAEVENKRTQFDEINRQRYRRLNMIRREAFKQQTERLKIELDAEKILADETIRNNERIFQDDQYFLEERLIAFEENIELRSELIKKESAIEQQELKARYELNLISAEDYEKQKQLIELKYTDQAMQLQEDSAQFLIDLHEKVVQAGTETIGNFFGNVGALLDENTIATKAAAVAQAIINTYLGATAAFAQTPGGIIIKSLAAAAAIAAGIANVRKILQVNPKTKSATGTATTGATKSSVATTTGERTRTGINNGGLTTQGLMKDSSQIIKEGMKAALMEVPQRNVLVVDEVTAMQNSKKNLNKVGSI